MTTLASKLTLAIAAALTSPQDLGQAVATVSKTYKTGLASGTGAGKADIVFADTRTLAASTSENLDLVGVLTDPLGATVNMLTVKGIVISAAADNTNTVVVGGAAATTWAALLGATGTVTLRPGSTFAAFVSEADASGYVAVGGASDLLKVLNGGAGSSVSYDITLIGTSV